MVTLPAVAKLTKKKIASDNEVKDIQAGLGYSENPRLLRAGESQEGKLSPTLKPELMLDRPPRAAAWLLGLFAGEAKKEQIFEDLSERFVDCATQGGRASARAWYWRRILKSFPRLLGLQFRTAPLTTILALAAGFEFRRLIGQYAEPALFGLIDSTPALEDHLTLYRFLASTGIDIAHFLTFLLVGVLVALIAGRRAMAPAVVLGFFYAGLAVYATVFVVSKSHDYPYLLRLSWYLSDAFAVIVGAALVRALPWNRMRPAAQ